VKSKSVARRLVDKLRSLRGFPNPYLIDGNRAFVHRDTKADRGVIEQIFLNEDYALRRLKRGEEIQNLAKGIEKPLIIDAGANIGASVCWFASQFPAAHIVAFEPDKANFELLVRNTSGVDVDRHQAAIGSRDGMVALIDPGEGDWAYRTRPDAEGGIPLHSISRVVSEKMAQGYVPFIAKIDIEGGEADLFAAPNQWVDLFPLIVVELHDWLLPKQGTAKPFLQCVGSRDRDFVHIGENIFSIRN
jgi:FkbM family methyltransferase